MSWLAPTASGVRLTLHIQPRASRTEIVGLHGEALKIRVAAPPVEGAANQVLIRWLADRLGLPRAQCTLIGGATSRRKVIEVVGATAAQVRQQLGLPG